MDVLAATDGSGGPGTAAQDARLRQVGWAFVIYTIGQLIPLAAMYGGTDSGDEAGDPEGQTVPLSEIFAMAQLLHRLAGDISATVYCDCSYVVNLFKKPLHCWPHGWQTWQTAAVHGHEVARARGQLQGGEG